MSASKWKPYPEYREFHKRWISSIPNGWSVQKIKFNSYVKGRIGWQNLRKDEFTEKGPYLVTGMHFKDGDVDWDNWESSFNDDFG